MAFWGIAVEFVESESCWQTCALLLHWWVEHQKSYRNMHEEGRWLICLPQGDISSVPNLSHLHLSCEQLIAAVSSSRRKRKSCSTTIPVRCCDSCHLLAGPGWLSSGPWERPGDRTSGTQRESQIMKFILWHQGSQWISALLRWEDECLFLFFLFRNCSRAVNAFLISLSCMYELDLHELDQLFSAWGRNFVMQGD